MSLRLSVFVFVCALVGCATPGASAPGAAAQRECKVDANGEQVCGYHCMIGSTGQVACADSADGTCSLNALGQVSCTQAQASSATQAAPSASTAATGTNNPAPECETVSGTEVCGYHCVDAFGARKCAHTPAGACKEAFGKVTCWDPSAATIATYGNQPAECLEQFGKIACGYHCQSAFGMIACAQTPVGHCDTQAGELVCTDP